jgi:hypothetical protein
MNSAAIIRSPIPTPDAFFSKDRRGTADRKRRSENDELLRTLAARLAENGPDADRLRRAMSESMGKDCFDSQEHAD